MALTKLICQYTVTGFIICFIFSDQEFLPVLHHFKEATPSIDFNLANSNKHVPEAEQNNRNSQEHMCATFHSLSFHSIPAILIRYSASETVEKLNFSPEIGGVLCYYSPCKILAKHLLDYEKHCTIPQFGYFQARHKPSPRITRVACTLDCIFLHLSIASRAAIAYTIWPQMGFLCIVSSLWFQWLLQLLRRSRPCQGRWHEQACAAWQIWKIVLWFHLDCRSGLYRLILWQHLSRPRL